MIESSSSRKLTEAQSEILFYWRSLHVEGAAFPKRGAFDPGAVLRFLRDITILELTEAGQVTCRVASSALRARFRGEAMRETQTLGLQQVLSEHAPARGRRLTAEGTHFWLRLPMLSDCGSRMLVLCHDEFVEERGWRANKDGLSDHLSTPSVAVAA